MCVFFFLFDPETWETFFSKKYGTQTGATLVCVFFVCAVKVAKGKINNLLAYSNCKSAKKKRFMKGSAFINDAVAKQSCNQVTGTARSHLGSDTIGSGCLCCQGIQQVPWIARCHQSVVTG